MIKKELTEVCTERIELLFFSFFKEIFDQYNMDQPSEEECRIILSKDFKYIVNKLLTFADLKHRGKYGLLDEKLQRKLNLKLLILDILNQSVFKKRVLIQEIIKENDRLLSEKLHSDFRSRVLAKALDDHQHYNAGLECFLKKVERLYFLQKAELRKSILDNQFFQEQLIELEQIYIAHLGKKLE